MNRTDRSAPPFLAHGLPGSGAVAPVEPERHHPARLAGGRIPLILVFVAVLTLATHFLFFGSFRDFMFPDSYSYLLGATRLATGHGFTNSLGDPETMRTPGYPLLIVPFLWAGLSLSALVAVQHLVWVLIGVATAAFAFQLSGSPRNALITGILISIDLPTLQTANGVLTETFFTAVLAFSLWLFWTAALAPGRAWTRSLFSGLLLGVSVMVRPISVFIVFPGVVYLGLTRKCFRFSSALSFGLAFALLPLLWSARNYRETGYFTLSTIPAWNMLGYRAAGVLAIDDPGDFVANFDVRHRQLQEEVCNLTKDIDEGECRPLIEEQRQIPLKSQYYMRLGRTIVEEHPVAYAKLAARGATLMMLGEDSDLVARLTGIPPKVAARVTLVYTLPMLCCAFLGAWELWKRQRAFFYLAAFTVVYFVVISSGAETYSRFRVPIMPLYALLAASGLDLLLKRRGSKAPVSASAD